MTYCSILFVFPGSRADNQTKQTDQLKKALPKQTYREVINLNYTSRYFKKIIMFFQGIDKSLAPANIFTDIFIEIFKFISLHDH